MILSKPESYLNEYREYRRGNTNGQSRETCTTGYTKLTKKKKKHTHTEHCVGHHYTKANTKNVNKT